MGAIIANSNPTPMKNSAHLFCRFSLSGIPWKKWQFSAGTDHKPYNAI